MDSHFFQKSYKGSFNVRLTPDLYRHLAISTRIKGKSLNQFINKVLEGIILEG